MIKFSEKNKLSFLLNNIQRKARDYKGDREGIPHIHPIL